MLLETDKTEKNPIYNGASVLPYTIWPNSDRPYFLLGEETYGRDTGCCDDWGGSKDKGELHPIVTAAREFTEETMGLLGSYSSRHYIDLDNNTEVVMVNESKKMIVYVTYIPPQVLSNFSKMFYKKRLELQSELADLRMQPEINYPLCTLLKNKLDKQRIGWISRDALIETVISAPRTPNGKLIKPVMSKINIIDARGNLVYKKVPLRPIFVSKLKNYFREVQNENEEV